MASLPLAPAGARGPAVRRSLLDRQAPALPCFLLNNIAREAPAESARHNFLPGWGWAAVARDNPRCPCFLSPLAQPSAPGAKTPPSPLHSSQAPGPHLGVSREEEAARPGCWHEGAGVSPTYFWPDSSGTVPTCSWTLWGKLVLPLWGRLPCPPGLDSGSLQTWTSPASLDPLLSGPTRNSCAGSGCFSH